jgi:hypothetical protein
MAVHSDLLDISTCARSKCSVVQCPLPNAFASILGTFHHQSKKAVVVEKHLEHQNEEGVVQKKVPGITNCEMPG